MRAHPRGVAIGAMALGGVNWHLFKPSVVNEPVLVDHPLARFAISSSAKSLHHS